MAESIFDQKPNRGTFYDT